MSNIELRTEPGTHDRFRDETAFDSIVAQDHIRSEFFSKLLECGVGFCQLRTCAPGYSGNPAFRRPSINSFAFEYPPRAINADIVKAGSISSTRAAASCASASRPRWAKADARQR